MQIDHDPREISHKALKIVGVLTVVITIALIIPINMAIRWGVTQLPDLFIGLFGGIVLAGPVCFFIGRWDTLRGQRTPRDG